MRTHFIMDVVLLCGGGAVLFNAIQLYTLIQIVNY